MTFKQGRLKEDIRNIEEPVFVLMFLVDAAHESGSRRQNFVDKNEDGLLGRELDPLSDDVAELADCQVRGDEILLLVYCRDV